MILKNRSGFLQISFAWLFAIIVGIFILGLAIFASTKFSSIQETSLNAQSSKEIGILLNPLETSFETGTSNFIGFPSETRIHNRCNSDGYFGRQNIKVSQMVLGKWTETDVNASFGNKYLFSYGNAQGEKFFVFSKPFEFPFKVADIIYLTSSKDKYCFINPPDSIEKEITNLNQENLFLDNSCPYQNSGSSDNVIRVCFFPTQGCDVDVSYSQGYVDKKNESRTYFYGDGLMYASIFSDNETYECQVKRIIKRGEQLTNLYDEKSNFISQEAKCKNDIGLEMLKLNKFENSFNNSKDFNLGVEEIVNNLQRRNEIQDCRLW